MSDIPGFFSSIANLVASLVAWASAVQALSAALIERTTLHSPSRKASLTDGRRAHSGSDSSANSLPRAMLSFSPSSTTVFRIDWSAPIEERWVFK